MPRLATIVRALAVAATLVALVAPRPAACQILVAPPVVFMQDQERVSHYLVQNTSDFPQEVSVSFQFGYPAVDVDGEVYMEYEDLAAAAQYSIADQIRAFPRQFVLQPGQRQRVRLMLHGDGATADGAYWTRIITSSIPVSPTVESGSSEGITTRITVRMNSVTTLIYRRGEARTGVEIADLSAQVDGGHLVVRTALRRVGNSPFIGSRIVTVRDVHGQEIQSDVAATAIYFDQERSYSMAAADLPPGEYDVELRFVSRRADVADSHLLPVEPISAHARLAVRGP